MKFRVTVEYRATVTVEVEAENERQADTQALIEADQSIGGNLHVYNVTVKEL